MPDRNTLREGAMLNCPCAQKIFLILHIDEIHRKSAPVVSSLTVPASTCSQEAQSQTTMEFLFCEYWKAYTSNFQGWEHGWA